MSVPPSSRTGVELSLNTVIIMVIGLLAAAILIYLLATNVGRANKGLSGCIEKGGTCIDANQDCPEGYQRIGSFFSKDCTGDNQVCCAKPLS